MQPKHACQAARAETATWMRDRNGPPLKMRPLPVWETQAGLRLRNSTAGASSPGMVPNGERYVSYLGCEEESCPSVRSTAVYLSRTLSGRPRPTAGQSDTGITSLEPGDVRTSSAHSLSPGCLRKQRRRRYPSPPSLLLREKMRLKLSTDSGPKAP